MSGCILLILIILFLFYLLNKNTSRTFVSMSPEKNHLPYLHKTIDSLLNGSVKPHKIILNIPESQDFDIPTNLFNNIQNKLIINKCKNFNEGNILLPTLLNRDSLGIADNDHIMTTSDKIDYSKHFLKNMISKCLSLIHI